MKVSVCVPVYGVEKYIGDCAQSLLSQDYQDMEFIFVNDCTRDASMERLKTVCSKHPDRDVKIIRHKQNRGLSAARNTALENATGEYILPIDSDDYLSDNNAVSRLVTTAISTGADIVRYAFRQVYRDKFVDDPLCEYKKKSELVEHVILKNERVCLCGMLIKRSLFIDNCITSIEGLNFGEDYAVTPRLLSAAELIAYNASVLYCYNHTNLGSYTRNISEKHVEDACQALAILENYFCKDGNNAELITKAKSKAVGELLILWGLSEADSNVCKKILKAIPVSVLKTSTEMRYKTAYLISKMGMYGLLRTYARLGMRIKQGLK